MSTKTLQEDIESAQLALSKSPIFALREITVGSEGDHLVLSGRVSTFYYKQLAQEAVRAVLDDVHVVNCIDVD